MEHTPGQWTAHKYDVVAPKDKKNRRIVVAKALSSGDTGRANAKLMAASPVMLEALEDLVYQVDRLKGEESQVLDTDQATAAIEAARSN